MLTSLRSASLRLVLLPLLACSGVANSTESPSTFANSTPSFEVHEWGVINLHLRLPMRTELGAGPGTPAGRLAAEQRRIAQPPQYPLTVDKPVLYVHAGGNDPFSLRARVRLHPALVFAEIHPAAAAAPGAPIEWNMQVRPASCADQASYPAPDSPACAQSPDGYCELAELGDYVTEEAACLAIGGQPEPLLFYRGTAAPNAAAFPAPLAVQFEATQQPPLRIQRLAAQGEPVGRVWLVEREGEQTRVRSSAWPEPGQVSTQFEAASVEEAIAAMGADLGALGMSEQESAVFLRTWTGALFGEARDGDGVADGIVDGRDQEAPPSDAPAMDRLVPAGDGIARELIYWWPKGDVNRVAELSFEPEPASLARALLVRVRLSER